ncbi:MAG: extracellular solute-binding protein [Thiobacillus sp.]|nr:extracellular solute-binding protein [Thiobacillus sp.]MDP2021802.1 extracellular solute-binding protein [Hydrogenophaga sp.]
MSNIWNGDASRRDFLKLAAAAGAAGTGALSLDAAAQAGQPINFYTWSAAVDLVKSHLTAFESSTGLKVNYNNAPWAQYRDTMVTKFVGKAPLDVMWVSDSWLPEWAEAGWIAPIDGFPSLMKYNADADTFCNESMRYKGKQYGLTYYTDYMAFFYDEEMLKKAGIKAPPTTWDELLQQSLKIKGAGLSEYPMMLSMARESWLIEFLSAMVFSNGGRFTDADGSAVMADPKRGAHQAMQWVVDAVNKHKIISPACVETGELNGLKAFGAGNHAFALLSRYRVRTLNDPKQSAIAGRVKQALMPMGPGGSHATVGWMRFHGMSTQAAADKTRAANAAKLIEWFGGKAGSQYQFQKMLFSDLGSGFGVKELFRDPEVQANYKKYSDIAMYEAQQKLARKKDVIAPWFGEWDEVNGTAWQTAVVGKSSVAAALKKSSEAWNDLRKS